MTQSKQHLDFDTLNELKVVMGDEFSLLIDTFKNDSIVRVQAIKDAVASVDPEEIRRAAHSFKGSASNMGATELTRLCRELEDLGRSGQVEGSQNLLEQITTEYECVESLLKGL